MCISGLGTRYVHPIRAAENGRKRNFVQKNPIFSIFSQKPPVTTELLVVM